MIDHSNDEINFPHKLLLTSILGSRLRKAFANASSVNIKISKIQLYNIVQLGEFILLLSCKSPKVSINSISTSRKKPFIKEFRHGVVLLLSSFVFFPTNKRK